MIFRCAISFSISCLLCIIFCHNSIGQQKYGALKTICIDAGHGGKDPGCIGTKIYEKKIVLDVALKLGAIIKKNWPNCKVVYTRDKDEFIGLQERGTFARDQKADVFVSIHVNAVDNKTVKGVETYVLGSHKSSENLQIAMKENAVIKYEDNTVNYAGFDPSNPASYILFSLMQNSHLVNSMELAHFVQSELVSQTKRIDRNVRQAPYWVLKEAAMPAILVEIGYISNYEEERYISSSDNQQKIANALFKALQSYNNYMIKHAKALTDENKTTAQNTQVTSPVQETTPNSKIESPIVENYETSTKEEKINTPIKTVDSTNKTIENKTITPDKPKEIIPSVEEKKLFYAIQIASSSKKMRNSDNFQMGEPVCELFTGGRYRYYVGKSATLDEVKTKIGRARQKVKDCFVIAVYKGNLISLNEAKQLETK